MRRIAQCKPLNDDQTCTIQFSGEQSNGTGQTTIEVSLTFNINATLNSAPVPQHSYGEDYLTEFSVCFPQQLSY